VLRRARDTFAARARIKSAYASSVCYPVLVI